jgi:hypothetical protein
MEKHAGQASGKQSGFVKVPLPPYNLYLLYSIFRSKNQWSLSPTKPGGLSSNKLTMEQQEPLLLESLLEENKDRNNLVPLWMKIFSLIFIITGILAFICLFAGLLGAT